MARRVYLGREPVSFITGGIGHVEPGGVIEVPGELLEAFDRRPDIAVPDDGPGAEEQAGRRRPGGKRPGGPPATEAQQEAAPCSRPLPRSPAPSPPPGSQ